MKKKLLILNIGVVVAVIAAFIFLIANRGEYLLQPSVYFSSGMKINSAEMTCDKEGIVELEDAYLDDTAVTFKIKAVGKGRTKAVISYNVEYENSEGSGSRGFTQNADFEVIGPGIIIDRTAGINFSGYRAVIIAILAVFLLTEIITLWIYAKAILHGEFNYSMVSFGGIGIFTLALQMFIIYKMINNGVRTFGDFLGFAYAIGELLFYVLIPVMLVMAVSLAVSNLWLMRHEGYRPANALGIVFAVLWFVGTLVIFCAETDWLIYGVPGLVVRIAEYIACYLECMFIATAVSAFLATKFRAPFDKDYIIILGCRIRKDGSLTPLLKGRVDRALSFEKAQYEKTGKHAVFVPSGGQGPGEVIPEGEAMENYILSQGIPEEQVIREDKSTNTLQNMKFSKGVISAHCGDISKKKIAFSTTNYHVFRGYILAKRCGFDAQGLSAKTRAYFYPNAFLREFVGLLADQKVRHIVYLACLILLIVAINAF